MKLNFNPHLSNVQHPNSRSSLQEVNPRETKQKLQSI